MRRSSDDQDYQDELARVLWRIEQAAPQPPWPGTPGAPPGDAQRPVGRDIRRHCRNLTAALVFLAVAVLLFAYALVTS